MTIPDTTTTASATTADAVLAWPDPLTALDLYAGTGWGVACQRLDIREYGVEIMPAAIATREANGMDTIYNDVWDGLTDPAIVPDHDILIASPPCFGAGTPVLTQRGSVNIEDVRVGDYVFTHKLRWRRVTATMSRQADTIRIGPVVTTPDHPFYARSQVRSWDNSRRRYSWNVAPEPASEADQWVPAGDSKGVFFATPLAISGGHHSEWEDIDAWLAGRYVADGWTGRDGVMLAIGDGTEEPNGEWVISQTGPHCRRFTRADHQLAGRLHEHFGKFAHAKTLPTWIFQAPIAWRETFLDGYVAGDGHHLPSGRRATTVSAHLASQLRLLTVGMGMTATVLHVPTKATTMIEGRVVNQRDQYAVIFIDNDHRYTRDRDGFRWTKQRKEPKQAGMQTVYDITVDEDHSFTAWGYIVHNCQTFSMAGKGTGRKALDDVLGLIEQRVHEHPEGLKALTEQAGFDDRTALVLAPLAYAYRHRPRFIAWEQVPTVLPVWEACAEVLRSIGYSVKVENLHAEQYGVPQTRKRAILVARNDGAEVALPTPTHSRYYSHKPDKLDPGVQKWVSMAEALGWGHTDRELVSNYGTGGDPKNRGVRSSVEPAATVTSKADRSRWDGEQKMSVEEAAALQSYPPFEAVKFMGSGMVERHGDRPGRPSDAPAFTIRAEAGGMEPGGFRVRDSQTGEERRLEPEQASLLQSYERPFVWCGTRTQQFLQIGNAVPPLLAHAVLVALTAQDVAATVHEATLFELVA